MQLTSSPRRALGLVAVGALGMSTAVLGVTGTASAAETSSSFTTASGPAVLEITADPRAQCTVIFQLDGAGGGAGIDATGSKPGAAGGRVTGKSDAINGDKFDLLVGGVGGDGTLNGPAGAGGTHADTYDGLDGYTDSTSIWGGGGGGASTVARAGDSPILAAFGGAGGLATEDDGSGGNGGQGGNGGVNTLHADGVSGTPTNTGNGVISGTVTCVTKDAIAPGAPTLRFVEAGDGAADFQFTPGSLPQDGYDSTLPAAYEYQLDGGAWKSFTPGFTGSDDLTGSVTGLTNNKKYSLAVRATSTAGNSPASAPMSVTPFRMVGAPTKATVTTGPGSLTISWAPPADATGVIGYMAWALPGAEPQSDAGLVECPELDAAARSCTIGVPVGTEYSVGIRALDANGVGDGAWLVSDVVEAAAAPSALPKSSGALSTDKGSVSTVSAGGTVTLTGGGYLPFSTVTLVMYSDPVVLGTTEADADGNISATVTLPAGISGEHTLVASGVDPSGQPHNLTMAVTVAAGAGLPNTGASIALPALGGLVALGAGGGLIFAARRRTAA